MYKTIWSPFVGEELLCHMEDGNLSDPYAVAVTQSSHVVVGHVPRKISAACSLFISLGRIIDCTVTGSRRYSSDLIQGGLEIPCRLAFRGESGLVEKIRKLVKPLEYKKRKLDYSKVTEQDQPNKKYKNDVISIEEEIVAELPSSESLVQWVKLNRQVLYDRA